MLAGLCCLVTVLFAEFVNLLCSAFCVWLWFVWVCDCFGFVLGGLMMLDLLCWTRGFVWFGCGLVCGRLVWLWVVLFVLVLLFDCCCLVVYWFAVWLNLAIVVLLMIAFLGWFIMRLCLVFVVLLFWFACCAAFAFGWFVVYGSCFYECVCCVYMWLVCLVLCLLFAE